MLCKIIMQRIYRPDTLYTVRGHNWKSPPICYIFNVKPHFAKIIIHLDNFLTNFAEIVAHRCKMF